MSEFLIKNFNIDGAVFSPKNPLIIAELGTSHNGDIFKAKEMIDAASLSGALCVKFQIVYADEILHPNTGFVDLPGGKIRLFDRFKALECPNEFYTEVKEYAESKGLVFLCTPFGLKSASILRKMHPKMVKIASPELNYIRLLEEVADWGAPALLSSGVSRLKDIELAIEVFQGSGVRDQGSGEINSKSNITYHNEKIANNSSQSLRPSVPQSLLCLLHCVTSYPAPETDYNLRVLPNLARIFGVSVGVSDHSLDPELVPALAVCMGASVIEKHFCLSRNDPGLDDPIALPPDEFRMMVNAVRNVSEQLTVSSDQGAEGRGQGSGEISSKYDLVNDNETIANNNHQSLIIEYYKKERGNEFIEQILGTGVKELAFSERANYRYTNRSIHALRDIKAGDILSRNDYAVLRTEKNLHPGLEPCWENAIEGRIAKNDIPAGEGIRFQDI